MFTLKCENKLWLRVFPILNFIRIEIFFIFSFFGLKMTEEMQQNSKVRN